MARAWFIERVCMESLRIVYRPIGIVHSSHLAAEETPIQPVYAKGCKGTAEIFPEFSDGLRDLEGFSHIYLIYQFHKESSTRLVVKPFLQDLEHGVFATRATCRPNAIGLSVVELLGRHDNVLYLDSVDILDGAPLLDIKPYTAKFDRFETRRNGSQDDVDEQTARDRGRRSHRCT